MILQKLYNIYTLQDRMAEANAVQYTINEVVLTIL